jgi:glycogen debranching enzyme
MLSIVDIVLNHTANDSKWIVDHPEATYNTDDCPHLYCAWLFDKMIQDFSIEYADRKIPECPAAPYIRNEAELDTCMNSLGKRVIEQIKVHEFFLCDVRKVMRE